MTPVTKENLLSAGWTLNTGGAALFAPIEKVLSEPDQEYEQGETPLALEINRDMNAEQFSLRLCDGSKLDLGFESMEEIASFEKVVLGFRPNY